MAIGNLNNLGIAPDLIISKIIYKKKLLISLSSDSPKLPHVSAVIKKLGNLPQSVLQTLMKKGFA